MIEYIGITIQEEGMPPSINTILKIGSHEVAKSMEEKGFKVWLYENGEWEVA